MTDAERPQIYLVTPPEFDLETFPDILAAVLDSTEIACLRMALSTQDTDQIMRSGDVLRDIVHARDIPLVIQSHVAMVERLGLDGVHLTDGARSVRQVRKDLGGDAIIGAFCGTSRHDGMSAGEAGADYISFGPVGATGLDGGEVVDIDVFQWWSEVVEVPVVAEGSLDEENLATISKIIDFIGLGPEIWTDNEPAARLISLTTSLN